MKQKEIIVISIVVILAILACVATFLMVNSHEESLGTLRISNSCTIEAPITNNSVEHLGNGVIRYVFESSGLNITSQKTENNSEIKKMNSDLIKNSEEVETGIYYDGSNGIYSAFIENNETGDAILITCKDLNLLKSMKNSLKFTTPKTIETTDNTTEEVDYSYSETDYSYSEEYYPTYEETYYPSQESSSESTPTESVETT